MSQAFSLWYEKNYHQLTGNGIWLRGGEPNTIDADQFDKRTFKVLISRLSTSWDVSDSYTHKILYEIINDIGDTFVDMSFLPPPCDGELMLQENVPWLLGATSKQSGVSFDVIAFSNSIIQEIINIPILLEKSGIPISKKERCRDDGIPIVILGGANALFSSALICEDPVVDGVFVGESAAVIGQLFQIIKDNKKNGVPKAEILTMLESVDGFFQPESRNVTVKYSPKKLEKRNLPSFPPLMYISDQPGQVQVPISEGCPSFCSFCAESWSRKPYREFTLEDIRRAVVEMKASLGGTSVKLYSFNFSMHSSFYAILFEMVQLFSTVKVSSQRFDHIADDPSLLQYLHAIGKSTFTCGLEGISGRLRKYLHKSLDDIKLRSSLSVLMRSPIRELKIFLIATGKESDEDYDEFREFLTYIMQLMQSIGRKPRIIFSMTPLVRFPFTPLECEDAPEPAVYHAIIHQVERLVKCRGMEFRTAADINDYLLSQILVRASNDSVLKACIKACHKTSFVYYREVPEQFTKELLVLLSEMGLSIKDLLRGWNRSQYKGVPVQTDVDIAFLELSANLASRYEDNGYCSGSYNASSSCRGCGSCKDQETKDWMTSIREREIVSLESFKKTVKNSTNNLLKYNFLVNINTEKRGIPRSVIGALISKAFMQVEPELIKIYKGYSGSHIEEKFCNSWITGDDIITSLFNSGAEAILKEDNDMFDKVNKILFGWCSIKGYASEDSHYDYKLALQSPYKTDPSVYCMKNQLKYTQFKNSDGSYRFEFTPQTLKKNNILSLCLNNSQEQSELSIQTGFRFNLEEFLEVAFLLPDVKCKVRIKSNICITPK